MEFWNFYATKTCKKNMKVELVPVYGTDGKASSYLVLRPLRGPNAHESDVSFLLSRKARSALVGEDLYIN